MKSNIKKIMIISIAVMIALGSIVVSDAETSLSTNRYSVYKEKNYVYCCRYWTKLYKINLKTNKKTVLRKKYGVDNITKYGNSLICQKVSNGGIGPICKFDLKSKKLVTLYKGLSSGYTIYNDKIIFSEREYEDEVTYYMDLDGKNIAIYNESIDTSYNNYKSTNNKKYRLIDKIVKRDKNGLPKLTKLYLRTPKGDIYLESYKGML